MKEAKIKYHQYRDARQERMKLLKQNDPTTGDSKRWLCKIFDEFELDEITRKALQCITGFELIRGDLPKLDLQKLMTNN